MQVGDKVLVDGKETEITATAYDDCGVKVYTVKGSMKDYYEEELKVISMDETYTRPLNERDKKILKEMRIAQKLRKEEGCKLVDCGVVTNNINLRIEIIDLKRELREQEKIIELMAQTLFSKNTCLECENVEHKKAKNKYKVCIECIKKFYTNQAKEMK